MPIHLNNPELDSRLNAVAQGQPTRVSRHALAEAMLDAAITACEQAGNPEAWRAIGSPATGSTSAPSDSNGAGSIRPAPITSASNGASSKSAAANSEAGAAVKAA